VQAEDGSEPTQQRRVRLATVEHRQDHRVGGARTARQRARIQTAPSGQQRQMHSERWQLPHLSRPFAKVRAAHAGVVVIDEQACWSGCLIQPRTARAGKVHSRLTAGRPIPGCATRRAR